jgi:cell division inhibitor SulA
MQGFFFNPDIVAAADAVKRALATFGSRQGRLRACVALAIGRFAVAVVWMAALSSARRFRVSKGL